MVVSQDFYICAQRTGLCAGGGLEFRPPGTAADSELQPKITTSSHTCSNTLVSGTLFSVMQFMLTI